MTRCHLCRAGSGTDNASRQIGVSERMRKLAVVTAAAIAASVPALNAKADEFPTKTVRLVVPYPPGGGVDNLARPLAERLSQTWKQPVIIENKPGASTMIGSKSVASA